MSHVAKLSNQMNGVQQFAKQEGKHINEEYQKDQKLQREWFECITPSEANELMSKNLNLQVKMEHEKADVEEMRVKGHDLESQAKEKELDSFVGTEIERELETGKDDSASA